MIRNGRREAAHGSQEAGLRVAPHDTLRVDRRVPDLAADGFSQRSESNVTVPTGPSPAADRAALAAYLSGPGRGAWMTIGEIEGFFFALAAAPRLRKPVEWLPLIMGGELPEFETEAETERVMGALFSVYNAINADVRERGGALPASIDFLDDMEANLEPDAPVSQWSRGFMRGHLWLEEDWRGFGEEVMEELSLSVWGLGLWGNRRALEATLAETDEGGSLRDTLAPAREVFPDCAAMYAQAGLALEDLVRELDQRPRPAVRADQPGRNEPCLCGSGRKYKKCCGRIRLV